MLRIIFYGLKAARILEKTRNKSAFPDPYFNRAVYFVWAKN